MITAECYKELIINFISFLEVDEQDCWFQQDGAVAHTEDSTLHMFSMFFGGCIISQNLWPPQSLEWILSLGVLEEHVQKQSAHIRRTETK
jgi:hypothetical protein